MTALIANDLSRTFKDVFSRLASGVCVVTFWRAGRLHGFTATSVTSVSMKPMRILFCLSETSESYPYLTPGAAVGISILNVDQRALSDRFASKVAAGAYDDVEICERIAHAPLLDGALGHVTGIVVDQIPSGDHAIILCDVTSAHAVNDGAPLLYCNRAYHSLRHAN